MRYGKKPDRVARYCLNNIAKEDLLAIARWGDEHHGVERSNQYRDDLKAHFVFLTENPLLSWHSG